MPAMFRRLPPYSGIRLSTSSNFAPMPVSRRVRFEPMNPSAPVTSTRRSANAPSSFTMKSFRYSLKDHQRLSIKLDDVLDDIKPHLFSQLRVDRQRQAFARRLFGHRQVSPFITKVCETFLKAQRHGVINFRPDAPPLQKIHQLIAP